jgi:predicted nucleic acid-binding protein
VLQNSRLLNGASAGHLQFWEQMLSRFRVLDFDSTVARQAVKIVQQLKTKRKSIDKPDLFIAATAIAHSLTLDTANKKHFIHIENLRLLNI